MKRKIAVIINPVAGKGKAIDALPILKQKFETLKEEIEVSYSVSKNKKNIEELTKVYLKEGFNEFLAIGGDGTLFELINGLDLSQNKNIKIGMVPMGTGNDFVKSLGEVKEIDWILNRVIDNVTQKVDIGLVNGSYFLNSCTFGIDGPITQKTEKNKKRFPGKSAYFVSTLSTALTYKSSKMRITIDNQIIEKNILMVAVCNGQYIGGGMKICPEAKVNDRLLEICLIEKVSPFKIIKEINKIYSGKLNEIDEVHYFRGENIKIESLENFALINADGNIIGTDPASISLHENQIEVFN